MSRSPDSVRGRARLPFSGSQSNSRTPQPQADELPPVRRPPRSSRGGAAGLIAAIIAFGLLGLAVRAVPSVLDDDLLALAAAPRAAVPDATTVPGPGTPSASPPAGPRPTATVSTSRKPGPKTTAPRTVKVPATGPGTYERAGLDIDAASDDGRLIRFDVRVEDNLDIPADQAARQIAEILNDERSWRGSGRWRFELVRDPDRAELHAYLVTPGTTDALCAPLQTQGEVSCQNADRVVLNAKRWLLGAEAYDDDLVGYRRYLVNHEFGHYIGYGHVECPGRGKPAPIMLQQTKGLDGCRKNPWVESD